MFVTWHNSSPELHIDPALALSRLHLHSEQEAMPQKLKRLLSCWRSLEVVWRGGGREGVQRHVYDGGHTPGCCSLRGSREPWVLGLAKYLFQGSLNNIFYDIFLCLLLLWIHIFAVPPFPVCSAGLIDVDMAVHQPRHHDVFTHVLDILSVGFLNFDIDTQ